MERVFVLLKEAGVWDGGRVLSHVAEFGVCALVGALADDSKGMLGCWAGQGRPEDVITLGTALTQRVGADHVRYAKRTEIIGGSDEQFAEALKAADQSDVVIPTLGENAPEMPGYAAPRAHSRLPSSKCQPL